MSNQTLAYVYPFVRLAIRLTPLSDKFALTEWKPSISTLKIVLTVQQKYLRA